jgi:hypothetical protein
VRALPVAGAKRLERLIERRAVMRRGALRAVAASQHLVDDGGPAFPSGFKTSQLARGDTSQAGDDCIGGQQPRTQVCAQTFDARGGVDNVAYRPVFEVFARAHRAQLHLSAMHADTRGQPCALKIVARTIHRAADMQRGTASRRLAWLWPAINPCGKHGVALDVADLAAVNPHWLEQPFKVAIEQNPQGVRPQVFG